jgi:MFS family permease
MKPSSSLGNIKLLGLFNFLGDFRLFGPILIIYFADVSGSFVLGGTVLALKMISQAIFEIPTGVLSDRIPRKQVAVLGAASTVAAVVAYAVAPGFEILVVGGVLEGLGRALYSGNNEALLWDSLAEHGRQSEFHRHSGRVNAYFGIALAISSILGGIIAIWSMRMAVGLTVIPQIGCVFVALMLREPAVHHDVEPVHPLRQVVVAFNYIIRRKDLRRLTVAKAVDHGGECGYQFQPAFIAGLWPTWAMGLIRSANHALSAVGFWRAGRVIDRFGPTKTLLGGSLFAGAIGLVMYGKPTVASPALIPLAGAAYGPTETAKSLLLQQRFTDVERATMGSLGQFLGSLFYGTFAIATGWIADAHSPQAALLACHVATLTTLPVYWWLHSASRERGVRSPA